MGLQLPCHVKQPAGPARNHAALVPVLAGLSRTCGTARVVPRVGAQGTHQVANHVGQQQPNHQQQPRPPTFREPPRPPELLGLGHMLPMMGYLASGVQFESLMLQWRQQYGPFFEFQMPGNPPVVVVSDPEAIKEVYEVKQYPKSPRYADLLPIVGGPESMLVTEGDVWKSQREAFNPGFSSDFLKAALPGFVSCTQNLVELLGRKADQQEVVQMHLVAILTTLEIITKVEYWDTDQGEHNAGKRQAAARSRGQQKLLCRLRALPTRRPPEASTAAGLNRHTCEP